MLHTHPSKATHYMLPKYGGVSHTHIATKDQAQMEYWEDSVGSGSGQQATTGDPKPQKAPTKEPKPQKAPTKEPKPQKAPTKEPKPQKVPFYEFLGGGAEEPPKKEPPKKVPFYEFLGGGAEEPPKKEPPEKEPPKEPQKKHQHKYRHVARYQTRPTVQGERDAITEIGRGRTKVNEYVANKIKESKIGTEVKTETIQQHKYARMADIAYSHSYNEHKRTKQILEEGSKYIDDMSGFKINEELSGKGETVLYNAETGEVHIAFRGSDAQFLNKKHIAAGVLKGGERTIGGERAPASERFKEAVDEMGRVNNVYDWWVNAMTVVGLQDQTVRYKHIKAKSLKVAEFYNIEPRDLTMSGHSKAGAEVEWLAEQLSLRDGNAWAFDPAVSPFVRATKLNKENARNVIAGDRIYTNQTRAPEINEFRSPFSGVSGGRYFQPKPHVKSEVKAPLPGNEFSPVTDHSVTNYYHDSPKINPEGLIEARRVTKIRNAGGFTGGFLLQEGLGELMLPSKHTSRKELLKDQIFLGADSALGAVALVSTGFPDVDFGRTIVEVTRQMGVDLTPEEWNWVHIHVFGGDPDPPPKDITADSVLTKSLEKAGHVRYTREAEYETQLWSWAQRQKEKGASDELISKMVGGRTIPEYPSAPIYTKDDTEWTKWVAVMEQSGHTPTEINEIAGKKVVQDYSNTAQPKLAKNAPKSSEFKGEAWNDAPIDATLMKGPNSSVLDFTKPNPFPLGSRWSKIFQERQTQYYHSGNKIAPLNPQERGPDGSVWDYTKPNPYDGHYMSPEFLLYSQFAQGQAIYNLSHKN